MTCLPPSSVVAVDGSAVNASGWGGPSLGEPELWSAAWASRPGFQGALQIRARKRPANTQKQYDWKVALWLEFNQLGDGSASYDWRVATPDKFDLFAGWLLGDAANGIKGRTTDKDLNAFRSAINRHLADRGCGRPLKGDPEISKTISTYRSLMLASKTSRGVDSDLHRVPCPESVFFHLLRLADAPAVPLLDLQLLGCFALQLLGWLRGDSILGLKVGDVVLSPQGELNVSVRRMKHRPDFATSPGLITIPAAPAGHPRSALLGIVRRCFAEAGADWYLLLSSVDLSKVAVSTGEARAAQFLTEELRRLAGPLLSSLPSGAVIGSHSWREMAAVSCFLARFDSLRMANHGFWREVSTMWNSYIRPYKDVFPYSRFLAQVFDFLRGV